MPASFYRLRCSRPGRMLLYFIPRLCTRADYIRIFIHVCHHLSRDGVTAYTQTVCSLRCTPTKLLSKANAPTLLCKCLLFFSMKPADHGYIQKPRIHTNATKRLLHGTFHSAYLWVFPNAHALTIFRYSTASPRTLRYCFPKHFSDLLCNLFDTVNSPQYI